MNKVMSCRVQNALLIYEKRRSSRRFSDPGGIRTPNQQNRNLSFYPIELRGRFATPSGEAAAKIAFGPVFQ